MKIYSITWTPIMLLAYNCYSMESSNKIFEINQTINDDIINDKSNNNNQEKKHLDVEDIDAESLTDIYRQIFYLKIERKKNQLELDRLEISHKNIQQDKDTNITTIQEISDKIKNLIYEIYEKQEEIYEKIVYF